ncbi:MAG: RluA family pseudouridine synthase [Chlamydiia bacterium]|nr:RluA family pseudouridine synthase [Chlamydiia bacterium]
MNKWKVEPEETGIKLIPFCKQKLSTRYSLKQIRFAIEHNQCYVNGKIERFSSRRIETNDLIELSLLPSITYNPQNLLYEDDYIVAYNKPPFISSENGLNHLLSRELGPLYLIHRLDRDTTGVILYARSKKSQRAFETLFRNRSIKKEYLCIAEGIPKQKTGVIRTQVAPIKRINGKIFWGVVMPPKGVLAITHFEVIKNHTNVSLLKCIPKTGRTHQIRVHLKSINHPILGDCDYGSRQDRVPRLQLHAWTLEFLHPFSNKRCWIETLYPCLKIKNSIASFSLN